MDFDVRLRIGRAGQAYSLPALFLDQTGMGPVCDMAGSYQIAAMGDQFFEYVLQPRTVLLPQAGPAFAPHAAFSRLPGKVRATSISGNIGEAIAAHWAVSFLNLSPRHVVHIKTTPGYGRRKSPDYLMRIDGALPHRLPPAIQTLIAPTIRQALQTGPEWWPVEAKTRESDQSTEAAFSKAFSQIVAYWHTIRTSQVELGYGIIVNFTSLNPQRILISVILPRAQAALQSHLVVPRTKAELQAYIASADEDDETVSTLHGF